MAREDQEIDQIAATRTTLQLMENTQHHHHHHPQQQREQSEEEEELTLAGLLQIRIILQ